MSSDSEVVGWRLDLVRHHSLWKGGAYQAAKLEFFVLLTQLHVDGLNLEVSIYCDCKTFEQFYLRWLREEGLEGSSLGNLKFVLIEFPFPIGFEFSEQKVRPKQEEFGEWIERVEQSRELDWEADTRLAPAVCPDCLWRYVQTQDDSIIGIWGGTDISPIG